jgi:putative drug exporter of the RND superfamily
VIAMLGLLATGVQLLYGVAIAAWLAVLLVLAASLTLLPALLSWTGRRIGEGGRRRRRGPSRDGVWPRWIALIQRCPAAAAVAATALMLLLAAPALGLRLAASDAGNDQAATTTRKAYDLLAEGFGNGFNGPLVVAVSLPTSGRGRTLARLESAIQRTPGVVSVGPARLNPAGDTAAVTVYPATSPQSSQTYSLARHLRGSILPRVERATGATAYVGLTASQVDFAHVLSSRLPTVIGIVIGLSALLLLIVFRSLLIPLQAALMNLLSIGAALGVVQAVYERGWLSGLVGNQVSPIEVFIPWSSSSRRSRPATTTSSSSWARALDRRSP